MIKRLAVLCVLILVSPAFGEDAPKLSPTAERAIASYDAQVEKAHAAYNAVVRAEQEKLTAVLKKELEALTKKGDLDGALAVKGRITALAMAGHNADQYPNNNVGAADLSAPTASSDPSRSLAGVHELVILKAKFGIGERFVDVTAYLRKLVSKGALICDINKIHDDVGDPAPFAGKVVIIDYILDGKRDSTTFPEGAIIKLGTVPPPQVGTPAPRSPNSPLAQIPIAAETSMLLEAFIDGDSDFVLLPGKGVQWIQRGGVARPGMGAIHEPNVPGLPTYLNGKEWMPKWADAAERGYGESDVYSLSIPPGKCEAKIISISEHRGEEKIETRDSIVVHQSGLQNIITIPDSQPGAMWYKIRINFVQ